MVTLHIKNMVCDRCKLVVTQELTKLGLHPAKVTLGEVELREESLTKEQQDAVDGALTAVGFARIDDRKGRLIESIKNIIIERIHHVDMIDRKFNWSDILAEALHHDYNSLSSLFSSVEGTTIEQYIIRQKIERAKELLFYDELNLSEIAHKLGYSSVAHLSAQFKKITGLSPSELKKSRKAEDVRTPIDSLPLKT
ncbi:MAG TPA: helix-turn-helix transcriptional regulator [Ohtaekwangia sp.]|uniref:helix-turn-helix domain-containing protein n=1 Tax=Ohtaekwangia sp. TaxID=2066019 RepID=UPI002F93770C